MTSLDVIKMIGDLIVKIDTALGDLMPNDPNRGALQNLRDLLDERQRKLAQAAFKENTQAFQDAAAKLMAANQQISATIHDVEGVVTTISNINRFVDAATSLLSLAESFV